LVVYINREKDKVSIRSTNGEAEKIARLLGGGGHENAAGADVKGIGKEEEKAYEKIEKIIRKVEQK
ncbi:MAG: DHHA1 domain-containing protein, partial [Candidatus Micrarchaeia archaeon]